MLYFAIELELPAHPVCPLPTSQLTEMVALSYKKKDILH